MINGNSVAGNAVIIGAGTMGGGIAALLANAGWQARLLDVTDQAARAGRERVRTSEPPLLYLPEFAERIQAGSTEEGLPWLQNADWVIEAVPERMEVKKAVMSRIEAHVGPETVVSTNTSGLSLDEMIMGRSEDFKRRFLGTHFLNPPRYLRLLEVIPAAETDPDVAARFARFAERVLGRRVVYARDTPGFLSTRIGIWHLIDTIHRAIEYGLTVEEADYLTGKLLGRPRSATFRMADIVGLDILADIARNLHERLEADRHRDRLLLPEVVARLAAAGRLGDKTGAGFYTRATQGAQALDVATLTYRPRQDVKIAAVEALRKLPLPERLRAIHREREATWGRFLNAVLDALSAYVRHVGPDIADDVLAVDRAMMWGFSWEMGPFAMGDLRQDTLATGHVHYSGIGPDRRYRVFHACGLQPMPAEPEHLSLSDIKAAGGTVLDSAEASLIDLGDGVACLEFHTKMNIFSPGLSAFVDAARERAERDFAALVIGNQGAHFSAGYDLSLFLKAIAAGDGGALEAMLRGAQYAFLRLKYARVPIVAAPHGYTLGAGCECVIHCAAAQAAPELSMGLPELAVGVVPAGGGTKEMLARAMAGAEPGTDPSGADPFGRIERVFDRIAFPGNSRSAAEARQMGFLRATDGVSAGADRQLYEAKQRAMVLANAGYRPPVKKGIWVRGEETLARLRMKIHGHYRAGMFSDHDRLIADRVALILSGGKLPHAREVSEEYLLQLERDVFLELAREPKSVERMRHVLETGKPLRN